MRRAFRFELLAICSFLLITTSLPAAGPAREGEGLVLAPLPSEHTAEEPGNRVKVIWNGREHVLAVAESGGAGGRRLPLVEYLKAFRHDHPDAPVTVAADGEQRYQEIEPALVSCAQARIGVAELRTTGPGGEAHRWTLPTSGPAVPEDAMEPLEVRLTAAPGDGVTMAHAGKTVTPDLGDELAGALVRIKQAITGAGVKAAAVLVVISPQARTPFGDVLKAFDAAERAGFARISLATASDAEVEPVGVGGGIIPATATTAPANTPATTQAAAGTQPAELTSEFVGVKSVGNRVVFVCDASGSMMQKFDPLRVELHKAIKGLTVPMQFNVVFFQETSSVSVGDHLLPTSGQNKQKVDDFVDATAPRGSTDPIPGLRRAMKMKPDVLYLLTDGDFPDNDAVLAEVRTLNAGKRVKINTIAFMDRGETYEKALQQMAKENGGAFRFVTEDDLHK